MKLKDYLKAISIPEVVDIVADLFRDGFSAEDVKDALPVILDQLIVLPPGLEQVDGAILKGIVNALWPLFQKKAESKRRVAATVKVS